MSISEYNDFVNMLTNHVIFNVQIDAWYKKENVIAIICDINDKIYYHPEPE